MVKEGMAMVAVEPEFSSLPRSFPYSTTTPVDFQQIILMTVLLESIDHSCRGLSGSRRK